MWAGCGCGGVRCVGDRSVGGGVARREAGAGGVWGGGGKVERGAGVAAVWQSEGRWRNRPPRPKCPGNPPDRGDPRCRGMRSCRTWSGDSAGPREPRAWRWRPERRRRDSRRYRRNLEGLAHLVGDRSRSRDRSLSARARAGARPGSRARPGRPGSVFPSCSPAAGRESRRTVLGPRPFPKLVIRQGDFELERPPPETR